VPTPLSAVLITLNAGRSLDVCLASVRFADELLVVDCGSTDATIDIATRHGARVIHQDWLGYGPQKQFAVEQARNDWVLCIDADEQVTPELRAGIERELRPDESRDAGRAHAAPRAYAFELCRCNKFMGRWLRHGEGYPDWTLRLFHRGHARWSSDPVHERVISDAPPLRLSGDLLHDSAETLSSYMAKQARYTTLQAEGLRKRGFAKNLVSMFLSPIVRFVRFYVLRAGFLDGLPGFVHIAIASLFSGRKYLKALLEDTSRSAR
jgi:glycosyltransferase involved in cell wall biosynthesis